MIPPHDALRVPGTIIGVEFFPGMDENLQDGEIHEPEELTTLGSNTAHTLVLP